MSDAKEDEKSSPQSAGGVARREALSPAARRSIAKKAAEARWGLDDNQLPVATYGAPEKPLHIGGIQMPCYVLQDGRRVLVQRAMVTGLGMARGGSGGSGGDRLAKFAAGKALKPYVPAKLVAVTGKPIRFRTPSGQVAYGYEATVLADICDAVLAARRDGKLQPQQSHIADRCEILVRGFMRVGIVALVDEATGYQAVRPQDALQKYLEMILRKELAAWSKRFPDEFYENIYKLRGWIWPGMGKNRYSVVAHYTRDLVYDRIAPALLKELETRSPKNEKGVRRNKLHQWLTDDVGHPLLAQHLHALIMLQRLAIANGHGWKRFVRTVDQVLPQKGQNLELPHTASPDPYSSEP